MSIYSQLGSTKKTIRKGDIAEVSRSLQVRLGLAKIKFQHDRLRGLDFVQDESEKPSDSLFNHSCSHCETRLTSPALRAPPYSKELPLSTYNEHTVFCDFHVTQLMFSARRKHLRHDFDPALPTKAAGVSWKRSRQLPKSSPRLNRHIRHRRNHTPLISEAPISELVSPAHNGASAEESDPDPLRHCFLDVSSKANLPPPLSKQARLPPGGLTMNGDRAGQPLYLGSSPTPLCVRDPQDLFLPSTPPFKHPTLATSNSGLGTPGQQFDFADFVNITPVPAQPTWSSPITFL